MEDMTGMQQPQQRVDPDYMDMPMNDDGKIFPSKWEWGSPSTYSMKKILLAMTQGPFNSREKDNIRVMDDTSVVDSFVRKYPELMQAYYPSDLRDIERALQLNWETFESQFMVILGRIKSREIEEEVTKKIQLAKAGYALQAASAPASAAPVAAPPPAAVEPAPSPEMAAAPIQNAEMATQPTSVVGDVAAPPMDSAQVPTDTQVTDVQDSQQPPAEANEEDDGNKKPNLPKIDFGKWQPPLP
jgi:hypothetical protein